MKSAILILNGPNLNLLGSREPHIYGAQTLADIEKECRDHVPECAITFAQSNGEAKMIKAIHEARAQKMDAIIINAAAFSHSSIAILDALNSYDGIVVEVHLSNIFAREDYRQHSFVSARADGIICGLKGHGYILALDAVQKMLSSP